MAHLAPPHRERYRELLGCRVIFGTPAHALVYGTGWLDSRLSLASPLVRTTTPPVREVAERVGFGDLPNFYRAFRRWTGTTPGTWRSRTGG